MRILAITLFFALLAPVMAQAQEASGIDLILPPQLESPTAPFYRGAKVKMPDGLIVHIREVEMPNGVFAEYHPELNAILVSNASAVSEGKKAQALMDVLSAMEASTIATAAGSEAK